MNIDILSNSQFSGVSDGLHYASSFGLPSTQESDVFKVFTAFLHRTLFIVPGSGGTVHISEQDKELLTGTNHGLTIKIFDLQSEDLQTPATVPEQLTALRAWLGLNISDLAKILLTTRPTVYSWQFGTKPRAKSLNRLSKLYALAGEWTTLCSLPAGKNINDRSSSAKSLLELLSAKRLNEQAIHSAMQKMAKTVTAAAEQRRRSSIAEWLKTSGMQRMSESTYRGQIDTIAPHAAIRQNSKE